MFGSGIPPDEIVMNIIILFFGIGLHEYAHCKVADMAGDPTPGIYGRVTLNLTKHFEPVGTIMMVLTSLTGFGFGWGRPAPINPSKMANPRWDAFAAVIAGPLCNVLQAIIYGLVLRVMISGGEALDRPSDAVYFCLLGVIINLSLACFNMIPLGILDGHWIVGLLLPEKPRFYWFKFMRGPGVVLLIVLIMGSQYMSSSGHRSPLGWIMGPPVDYMFKLITGVSFRI